jgi:tetratricopeptide (TPR) repeat protein
MADFNAALGIKPDFYEALNNRGIAYYNVGDLDRAIADWEEVLRINPNHANAKQYIETARQQR